MIATIPSDDPDRSLSLVDPDDPSLPHVAMVGDSYTVLLSGAQTAGRYTLIDMLIPPGGGPGPHRHDFEELFTVLEGEITLTFRGDEVRVRAGESANVPANAPHFFRNASDTPARMLCMCTPAGQEEFFLQVGSPLESRTAAAPALSDAERQAFRERAEALGPAYATAFDV